MIEALKNIQVPEGHAFVQEGGAVFLIGRNAVYQIPRNVRLAECILEASNEIAAQEAKRPK